MIPLTEGGNVFKNQDGSPATQRINQADVLPTVQWLESIAGLSLVDNMLGSTGKKSTSGDLDLAVDEATISKADLQSRLSAWATKNNLLPQDYVRKTGVSVHFKAAIAGDPANGYVQADFMFTNKLQWTRFVLSADPTSQYKGALRNILINSIAKNMGYKLNQNAGLQDRATNEIISDDPEQVAKILLGTGGTPADLSSVETIMLALKNDPGREAKIADFKAHAQREGIAIPESVQTGTPVWFRSIVNQIK